MSLRLIQVLLQLQTHFGEKVDLTKRLQKENDVCVAVF